MHPLFTQESEITREVIGSAIEVHREKGPGLLESINDCLLVELKAVEAVKPIHKAQLLSYMKWVDILLGLVININEQQLSDGVSRLILPGANTE